MRDEDVDALDDFTGRAVAWLDARIDQLRARVKRRGDDEEGCLGKLLDMTAVGELQNVISWLLSQNLGRLGKHAEGLKAKLRELEGTDGPG